MPKKSIIGAFAAALALALVGCAAPRPPVDYSDPAQVSARIKMERDDFKKLTNISAPSVAPHVLDALFLRAWKFDSGSTNYQIYVRSYYSGEWRFYNSAYDSNGVRMDVVPISRDVGTCGRYGCSHEEHLGLNVTRAYLESHKSDGIRFKVSGKAGEEIFFVPGGYIQAFLLATN
jgi:hypothetical protein